MSEKFRENISLLENVETVGRKIIWITKIDTKMQKLQKEILICVVFELVSFCSADSRGNISW